MWTARLRSALDACGVRNGRVLVAASAGLDSTVLLEGLRALAPECGLELHVGHVNHQLRGAEAEADAIWVAERAATLGIPFTAARVDPERARSGRASRDRPSLEESARSERRRALTAMADERGCRWIATGHHADDQAETVLLRILRGTGPDGLGAIAPRSRDGRWIRPLLDVDRASLRAWAEAQGLAWREDASNRDPRFTRNRLRHDWLPRLAEAFNPQLLRTLCDLAEAQRTDSDWIETLVDEAAKERIEMGPAGIHLMIDGWSTLPDALARRLVRRALVLAGIGRWVTRTHLERVLEFLRRGREAGRDKRIELPGGVRLRRLDETFRLEGGCGPSRGEEG